MLSEIAGDGLKRKDKNNGGDRTIEKEVVSIDFPQWEIEQKEPRKDKQNWRPSPWNKPKSPDGEKPAPIMMCKRCRHPR